MLQWFHFGDHYNLIGGDLDDKDDTIDWLEKFTAICQNEYEP